MTPQFHPAANLFPLLDGPALQELADDIRAHGLLVPIVMLDGAILDGRNRFAACGRAGVAPRFVDWDGTGGSPTAYVLSTNLHRRHLDESQRAMVGARAAELFAEEARERQRQAAEETNRERWGEDEEDGEDVGGDADVDLANIRLAEIGRAPLSSDAEKAVRQATRDEEKSLSANLRGATGGKAAEQAAAAVNVSPRSVESARTVLRSGAPELVAAVEQGRVAVSTAAVLTAAPVEEQRELVARGEREILARAKEIRAAKTEGRRQERTARLVKIAQGDAPLLAPQRFPILLADPPWRYEHAESESRAIENQYPTMDLDAICALPVGDVTTDDCVLFLWATSPKLAESMRVVTDWGFTYRTCMVWVKDKIGMGYYARQRHELLLIATKGKPPTPAPADRPDSVIEGEREEHSAKPPAAYEAIERMYPSLPKMEMFCRSPRAGWHAWGNQAGGRK